jgi:hypothetical protein
LGGLVADSMVCQRMPLRTGRIEHYFEQISEVESSMRSVFRHGEGIEHDGGFADKETIKTKAMQKLIGKAPDADCEDIECRTCVIIHARRSSPAL